LTSKETYFFSEHIRSFLSEKWAVAIQFPEDKNLTNQINARIELNRFVKTLAILDENNQNDYIPKQIDDLIKVINLVEMIQNCKNSTIHYNNKIYLDYLFASVVYSSIDNYESRQSKDIENNIINSIHIKERNRMFRKIISFGLA
jgi:hypothetical protein